MPWEQLLAIAPDFAHLLVYETAKYAISFLLIFVVLTWLAAIYRGGAGDEEIERVVKVCLVDKDDTNTITLAPRHLAEKSVHVAKAPKVEFFLQLPQQGKYSRRILVRPLKIAIRDRNREYVYDHTSEKCTQSATGGQIGIDYGTHEELDKHFADLYRREGRKLTADDAHFIIRFRYPSSLNIRYLLQEHPDSSVRVGAWIFILTSVFAVAQDAIQAALKAWLL